MGGSQKEAIVIILDIGHSVSQDTETIKSGFLENARQCVSMILKRKILGNLKDEVALILLGCNETGNSLNYKNIKVTHSLALPSWEMVQFVNDLKGTTVSGDWIDAVVVAMDVLKKETQGKKFSEKKLVLLSSLNAAVSDDKVDIIINTLKLEELNLIVIGPDIDLNIKEEGEDDDGETKCWTNGNDAEKSKSKQQLDGETVLRNILREAGGVVCSFADAVPQLMYFQKKKVRPTPWNVVMDIGPDIKLPVSGYRKISPATLPSWKTVSAVDKEANIETEKSYIRQDESQTVVEREEVIEGFKFGTTLVPFSDIDKSMMSYKSGEKCLSVLGFTKLKNVPRHLFVGKGVLYFVAQKGDSSTQIALSSLIHALKEEELVAIARKVYRRDLNPVLGVMFPRISPKYECFVFVELPYAEDMTEFVFPPIVSHTRKPTKEQLDSIDALIDNMDLQNVKNKYGEASEAFKSKSLLNPYHQHVYHCLAHRALNEDAQLPLSSDYVTDLLKSPYETKPSYKFAVEEVKKQFRLTEVKQKRNGKSAAAVFKKDDRDKAEEGTSNVAQKDVTMASLVEAEVIVVGTVKPDQDFKTLLERGEDFNTVVRQMQKVILDLVIRSFGADNFSKAETALRTLRVDCVAKEPSLYNEWVVEFRDSLFEKGRKAFWDILVQARLGLITEEESAKSSVTVDEAMKFMEYEKPNEEEAAPMDIDMDADALLNEMDQ